MKRPQIKLQALVFECGQKFLSLRWRQMLMENKHKLSARLRPYRASHSGNIQSCHVPNITASGFDLTGNVTDGNRFP